MVFVEPLANYAGPIKLSDLLHAVPHIDLKTWRYFTASVENIQDNYGDWVWSLGFLSMWFILFTISAVVVYFAYECSYLCGRKHFCGCCTTKQCPRLTWNRNKPKIGYMTVIILFAALAGASFIGLGYMVWRLHDHTDHFFSQGRDVQNKQTELKSDTDAGLTLLDLDETLRNASYFNETTSTQGKSDLQAAEQPIADARSFVQSAADLVDIDLPIESVLDQAEEVTGITRYASWGVIVLFLGLMGILYAVTYDPIRKGKQPSTGGRSGLGFIFVFFLLVFQIVAAVLLAVDVGLGDACQDPNGHITNQANSTTVRYYLFCDADATSPLDAEFDKAYNNIQQVFQLTSFSDPENIEPALMDFYISLNNTRDYINATKPDFQCGFVHNQLVTAEHTLCTDSIMEDFFWIVILLYASTTFAQICFFISPDRAVPATASTTKTGEGTETEGEEEGDDENEDVGLVNGNASATSTTSDANAES